LISQRFAVIVISILLGASTAGWMVTELIPPDFLERSGFYRARWGNIITEMIFALRLYDPFHSYWYTAVLALFFVVLLLCILTRWNRFVLRSFRFKIPRTAGELQKGKLSSGFSWKKLGRIDDKSKDPLPYFDERYGKVLRIDRELVREIFQRVSELFHVKGYCVVSDQREDGIFFTAVAGRWRVTGNFLFHIGILVIIAGGVIGSYWGTTEYLYGQRGEVIPLYGSSYSLRIEDFRIIRTRQMEIKDYISTVSILAEGGDTIKTVAIEVNRPLKFSGYSIYQSSYYVDEQDFNWIRIGYRGDRKLHTEFVTVGPDEEVPLAGTPFTLRVKQFLPDFRTGQRGPQSASPSLNNPAVWVELSGEGKVRSGWLFLYYPAFNSRLDVPVRLVFDDIDPVYYTGFQVSVNPGAPVLLGGILVATVGLTLLFLFNYRSIRGLVDSERLLLAGGEHLWRVSFEHEFTEIGETLGKEILIMLQKRLNVHS